MGPYALGGKVGTHVKGGKLGKLGWGAVRKIVQGLLVGLGRVGVVEKYAVDRNLEQLKPLEAVGVVATRVGGALGWGGVGGTREEAAGVTGLPPSRPIATHVGDVLPIEVLHKVQERAVVHVSVAARRVGGGQREGARC